MDNQTALSQDLPWLSGKLPTQDFNKKLEVEGESLNALIHACNPLQVKMLQYFLPNITNIRWTVGGKREAMMERKE